MRRWKTTGMLLAAAIVSGSVLPATAQTGLIGGGLTALPPVRLGPSLAQNGGFETLSGGLPASWSGGSGWGADQIVRHGGAFSYRRTTGAATSAQSVAVKKGIYKFSAWIKTESLGTTNAGMRLQMDMRPTLNQWFTTDLITGTRDWTLFELKNLVVPQDLTVTLKLENYGGPAGTAWFDDVKFEEQLAEPVTAYMLYPNFRGMMFDDQPATLKFHLAVAPPGGDFARYAVRGTLKDESSGLVVASKDFAAAAGFVAELDGSLMQYGRAYAATFALIDSSSGATAATYPAYRVSRVAASARTSMNVAVDAKNRVLVRGQPRFVLGVYDSGGGYSTADSYWENQIWSPTGLRRLDGLKINFYLNYWMGEAPADSMKALMGNLQKRGVMYLQTGNCFDKFPAGQNFLINSSDAYVRDIGSHPGSAGYYTADECRPDQVQGVFNQYTRLRSLDPDSMTFTALFGSPDLELWRDAGDVISTDPYPLFGAEPAGGYNHKQVADWTAKSRDVVKDSRPIMTVLQFFKFTSLGRWPTPAEMRNHAYMAIVEGAKGLWWWSVGNGLGALAQSACSPPDAWCPERVTHLNDLKALVAEVAALEPVLIADDAPGALSGNSNPAAIKTKVKLVGGKGYVFAYNATNAPVTATLTWNTAPGTVAVNGETRSVAASGASFTDGFGPYQAHVYVIANGGTAGSGGTTPPAPGDPTVALSNPAPGATVSGSTTVTMSASGGTTPYAFKVAVDGTTVYTGANNTFSWNTATVANGTHTLAPTVTDGAGKTVSGATQTVTVSNASTTPPSDSGGLTLAITAPKAGATLSGTSWVVLWLNGTTSTSNTYTLTVNGVTMATTATSSRGPVSIPWNTTKVSSGAQTIAARAVDSAGKTASAQVAVNVANTVTSSPLAVAFTAPAAGATVSGTTTVSASASGGTAPYTYKLAVDATTLATGTTGSYGWNTATTANGSHTLAVTVTDSAGRTASATRTVTVSNGLRVFITSPTAGATVSGTAIVNVWLEGQTGTSNLYTVTVDGRTVGTQTSGGVHVWFGVPTTGLINGSHTIGATVKDAAGKTGAASVPVTVRN